MGGWLQVLFQLVDFIVKACVTYSQTPAGEKELQDITVAWEERANNEDNGGSVSFSSESFPAAAAAANEVSGRPSRPRGGKPFVNPVDL